MRLSTSIRAPNVIARLTLAASLAAVAACGSSHLELHSRCPNGPCTFEPGDENDPVLRLAQAVVQVTTDTVQLTITNSTNSSWGSGLITFSPTFTQGAPASNALMQFVSSDGNSQGWVGDPNKFAQLLGLTVGTNAFVVPPIAKGSSVTLTIQVPSNVKISYTAVATQTPNNINSSGITGDFVAANSISLTGSVSGAVVANLGGYNAPVGSGVLSGNQSTGASPAGTTVRVGNLSDCPSGPLNVKSTLFTDNFAAPANNPNWAKLAGYDGDFNGDWYTDGTTARVYNPNWGGASPSAPIPTVTGFVKFINICPAANATLSVTTSVTTDYSDPASNTTLVVYFFDRAGASVTVTTNYPLKGKITRGFALYDAAIPSNARYAVVVPMAYLAQSERGTVYYGNLAVNYEPQGAYTTTSIVAENFQTYSGPANTPTGWSTFNGDWFIQPSPNNKWVTWWNPVWGGDQSKLPPVDTGLVKSFSLLGKYVPGDTITAQAFAAVTFTDSSSFVRIRLVFNTPTGPFIESDRLNAGWGTVNIRRQPIPAGAVSVYGILDAYLGPNERSSLYSNQFTIDTVHANPGF